MNRFNRFTALRWMYNVIVPPRYRDKLNLTEELCALESALNKVIDVTNANGQALEAISKDLEDIQFGAGGYYRPAITENEDGSVTFSFAASDDSMPPIEEKTFFFGDMQTITEMLQGFDGDPMAVKNYIDEMSGGYYTPVFEQSGNTITVSFTASNKMLPALEGYSFTLPSGPSGKSAYELAVENGFKGSLADFFAELQGKDGYTPIKGVDYFTAEEKTALVSELSQIPTPKIVSSVEEMSDTTKHYVLGNSIYAYMPTVKTVKTYTNIYNHAKMSSADFNLNHRYNSSHALVTADGYLLLDKLPVTHVNGATLTVRTKGAPRQEAGHAYCRIQLYNKDGGVISFANSAIPNAAAGWTVTDEGNGVYAYSQAINYEVGSIWVQLWISGSAISASDVANLIVTVNQEIKEETVSTYDWADSGISYTPTFKTDVIGVMGENNVIYISDNALPSGTYTLKYNNATYDTIGTITVE